MDLLCSYDDGSDNDGASSSAPTTTSSTSSSSSSSLSAAAAAPARPAPLAAAIGVAGDWPCLVFLDFPAGAARASPRRLAAACAAAARFRAFPSRALVPDDEAAEAAALPLRDVAAGKAADVAAAAAVVAAAAGVAVSEDVTFDARRLPPHVSLSRAFALRRHQVEPYVRALAAALRRAAPFRVRLAAAPSLFVNEARSRSFIALGLESGAPGVRALLEAADATQASFGRPPFFRPATPHVSVLALEGDAAAAAELEGFDVVREAGAGGGDAGDGADGALGENCGRDGSVDAGKASAVDAEVGSIGAGAAGAGAGAGVSAGAAGAGTASEGAAGLGANGAGAAGAGAGAGVVVGGRLRTSAVESLLLKARPPKRARHAGGAGEAGAEGEGAAMTAAALSRAAAAATAAPLTIAEAQAAAVAAPSEWLVNDVCLKVGHRLLRIRLGGLAKAAFR